ncbi:MAG: GNAT family N-acetyltransferase [Pseudomonadota bacterium]
MIWQDLATDRLRLRALEDADAGPITLYAGDERVARMTTIPHPYPPGAAEAFIARARAQDVELVWALDASGSGGAGFMGVIGYRPKTHLIGYWIGPPFWGQGYTAEAARALSDHVLRQGVDAVQGTTTVDNRASQRVFAKAGFSQTGTGQRFVVARDKLVDILTYEKRALTSGAQGAKGVR